MMGPLLDAELLQRPHFVGAGSEEGRVGCMLALDQCGRQHVMW